jgi:hypothetical protein
MRENFSQAVGISLPCLPQKDCSVISINWVIEAWSSDHSISPLAEKHKTSPLVSCVIYF